MNRITSDSELRNLADFSAHFSEHPDIQELELRGRAVVGLLDSPSARMSSRQRAGVGAYLIFLGIAVLWFTPPVWSIATQVATSGPAKVTIGAWGFNMSPAMAMILVVILMGLIGSVTVMSLVFARRAGNDTLEPGFVWWYATRPVTAAGLAVLFYVTAISGLLDLAKISGSSALVIAAALAALAGLFTDEVLAKMRRMLGLLPWHEPASGKDPAQDQ